MKETRLINRFSEKILIWGNGPFWDQKFLIHWKNFFEVLHSERDCVVEKDINFPKKICLRQMDHFGPKNGASL